MLKRLAGVVALSMVTLSASEACAEPLILRCDGIEVSVSVYEPTATRIGTTRYYRIDQQQFGRLKPTDVVWPANYCAKKRATCSVDESTISARWSDGRDEVTVQINRKSGRVRETTNDGSFSEDFTGDCAASTDPAQSDGPKRF